MSPRNPFKFAHGERRGKNQTPVVGFSDAMRSASTIEEPQPIKRKSRARFRAGPKIITWRQLMRWLDIAPSVWWTTINRPLPCTVVKGWPLRTVQSYLMHHTFRRVVR